MRAVFGSMWAALSLIALSAVLELTLARQDACAATTGGMCAAGQGTVLFQVKARASKLDVTNRLGLDLSHSEIRSGDYVYLTSHIGHRVTVMGNGSVHAQWRHRGEWEKLLIERADGASDAIYPGTAVFLTGWNLKRFTVDGKAVHAHWEHRGEWQKLIVERKDGEGPIMEGDAIFLKAWTGKYIDVNGPFPAGGVQARWAHRGAWQRLKVEKAAAPGQTGTPELPTESPGVQSPEQPVQPSAAPTEPSTPFQQREADAQFLIQATFGPTRSSLQELEGQPYSAWIMDQIKRPVESHRQYFRERVNPRSSTDPVAEAEVGSARTRCGHGSRWLGFAFSLADLKKKISVRDNQVSVEGVLRTEVDLTHVGNGLPAPSNCTDVPPPWWERRGITCQSRLSSMRGTCADAYYVENQLCQRSCFDAGYRYSSGDDCSRGWPSLSFEGYICRVEEALGGWVQLSESSDCKSSFLAMVNPGIWLPNAGLSAETAVQFHPLRPGVLVLAQTSSSCSLGDFMRCDTEAPGRFYQFDSRLELVQNSLEAPASSSTGGSCPTVPKTFLNEGDCRILPSCAPLSIENAFFELNISTLELFYTIAGRYVYAVTGLRTASSPCGSLSRWSRLDCSVETCAGTSLAAAQAEAIAAKLREEEGAGWLRDIDVECEGVPAHAVVQVDSEFFRHVHLHEYNVYDFTDWVESHPGGKNHIQKWAQRGFRLEFPQHHEMSRWESGLAAEVLRAAYIGKLDATVEFQSLPQSLESQPLAEALGAAEPAGHLFLSCGSPFEVANNPELGHQLRFHSVFVREPRHVHIDPHLEAPYDITRDPPSFKSKHAVWVTKALYARDQLRQRMAWALSQIFVAAEPGYGNGGFSEMWLNFYDIFVRNAFGNFRDVLREVTYSPVMGEYLSFKGNRAYDSGNHYPDENYAREIMQLFTIGLWKLSRDGSRIVDENGEWVPTYTNEHIMNFARVFTGFDEQQTRTNIEKMQGNRNLIDPMRMRADRHDLYPKPDLDGNYLGDGYPLCAELPAHGFLAQGAKYTFLGSTYLESGVLVLSPESGLYGALCSDAACGVPAPTRELSATLACHGEECKVDTVRVVKLPHGYYEYVQPTCVHLFFFNGRETAQGDRRFRWKRSCANPETLLAGTACCNMSADARAEARVCGYPSERVRLATAEARCASLGMEVCAERTAAGECGYDDMHVWTPTECQVDVEVSPDGKVSSMLSTVTKQNKFAVRWHDDFPSQDAGVCPGGCAPSGEACVCAARAETVPVFDQVPDSAELLDRLKIATGLPSNPCTSNCESAGVKAYAAGAAIDESTVFEYNGRFFNNQEHIVHVGDFAFRNPPIFVQRDDLRTRDALAEVESLLDHLLHHPNTPVFIARLLIQRFVTSNPSPKYVADVAEAFRSGTYASSLATSGAYGDLAATVLAILLHDEARGSGASSSATNGALREPLLKVVHFLRSMGYVDETGREVALRDLSEVIGQFPYQSPSVFNFYLPDYKPDRFSEGLAAPEFEIFTTPTAMSFLNGMMSLIQRGLGTCDDGFGMWSPRCRNGQLMLEDPGNATEAVAELDLLLTGGRLSSKEVIQKAYETAEEGDGFKAAQKAIVMTPEFHTLGVPLAAGPREHSAPEPVSAPRSYRAAVMLFLGGGADTFNMLVPLNCPLYDEYMQVRTDVALLPQQLHTITTAGQVCGEFGIHSELSFVKELYDQKQAAFVSNVGALVEPLTKTQFRSGGASRCAGLFSHSDQQQAAQTLKCQVSGASPKGAGGRLADALASGAQKYRTTSFTVAGTATWSQGFDTRAEVIDQRQGSVRFREYQQLQTLISNITSVKHGNVYCEEYAQVLEEAVQSSEEFGNLLDNVELKTEYKASSSLERQLKQVARLIAAREERKAERDFFFVSLGGFDTHRSVASVLATRFQEIDTALRTFVTELRAQDIFDSTVLVTHSDFGRTLTPNSGAGTDHAWAGNHMVLGGDLKGGAVFNEFPKALLEGNDQDAGRGRLIPKYPWESMMVPISEWMGVTTGQHAEVFPNLANFNASHIISRAALFRS